MKDITSIINSLQGRKKNLVEKKTLRLDILVLLLMLSVPAYSQKYTVQTISEDANVRSDRRPVPVGYYDPASQKTFVCWMGSRSAAVVKEYDHQRHIWSDDKEVGQSPFVDKHNYPAMLKGPDGRTYIFYGCHNSTLKMTVSPEAGSIQGTWQDRFIEEGERASYPAPVLTQDGIFYVFYRDTRKTNGHSDDRPYQFVKSKDGGKTWTRQMVIDPYPRLTDNMTEVYNGKVTYEPAGENTRAKIHIAWTIAGEKTGKHAHATYGRNVYYAYLDPLNDHMYNVAGVDLGETVDHEESDKFCLVWDSGIPDKGHMASLQVSALYREGGFPLVYYYNQKEGRAYTATWNKFRWVFSTVGHEGGEPRGIEKTGPESFLLYRPSGSTINIYETIDGGYHWHFKESFDIGKRIDRCYTIENYHPDAKLLLTEQGDGELIKANRDVFIVKSDEKKPASFQRASWMRKARFGVMTHYLADWIARAGNTSMTVDRWNELVRDFDVEGLADQLQSIGAGYYILTIGQNSGYYISPNKTYDKYVRIQPGKCSQRDLVSDMADALKKRGIKFIVYLPSGAPNGDEIAKEALQWRNGPYPNREFQVKWEDVIREWSLRWGDKVDGWWFDGCYWPNSMYRSEVAPNFRSFAEAARAGNSNSAVAFNPGVVNRTISVTPYEDYIAGEISRPELISIMRVYDGLVDGAQLQILSYLGERWGMGSPRFDDKQVVEWSELVWKNQGAITWDVPIQPNGLIAQPFIEQLKSVSKAGTSAAFK